MDRLTAKVVDTLLANSEEVDPACRAETEYSLVKHGYVRPKAVLEVCREYLAKNKRLGIDHRCAILSAITRIVRETRKTLEKETVEGLIKLAIYEMTCEKGIDNAWQESACEMAVEICEADSDVGVAELLREIPSSALPHYFIMKALADFAHQAPNKFVPHLKDVLAKVLPILSQVKQENMKLVFASALGRFSQAAVHYNAELEDRQETSKYPIAEFSQAVHTSLTSVQQDWAVGKDAKVRLVACEALGHMAACIDNELLETQFPKLVKVLLDNLKKEKAKEQLPIILGIEALLETSCERINTAVQTQLELIWNALHAQYAAIQGLPSMEQTMVIKNSNEILRTIEILGRHNCDNCLTYVQRTFDPSKGARDPLARAATLMLLKHMVSRLDSEFEGYKDTLIATVKTTLNDTDYKVCKAVVQCIIALANNKTNNYLTCEGGTDLIYYVTKKASITNATISEWQSKNKRDPDIVSPAEVRQMCVNMLSLFVSSMVHLDRVLWPFILECVGHKEIDMIEMFQCFPVICNCVHVLANRVKDEDFFKIDYDCLVNIPKPPELIAKYLVHVTQMSSIGKDNTRHIVQAMLASAPILSEGSDDTAVADLWSGTVPQLLEYLNHPKFDENKWEDVNHKLLASTVGAKTDAKWMESIADALMLQITAYNVPDRCDYKRVCLSMLGLTLSKCTRKEFVLKGIDFIIENCDHGNIRQRHGAAKALGFISNTNADAVLDKLGKVKGGGAKAATAFVGKPDKKSKAQGGGKIEQMQGTAALSYGHLTQKTQPNIMTSRMEASILPSLVGLMNEISPLKMIDIKENALLGAEMLAKGVRKAAFNLKSKEQLMDAILVMLQLVFEENPKEKKKAAKPPPVTYDKDHHTTVVQGFHSLAALLAVAEPKAAPEMIEKLQKNVQATFGKEWNMTGEKKKTGKDEPTTPSSAMTPADELELGNPEDKPAVAILLGMQHGNVSSPFSEDVEDTDEILLHFETGSLLCSMLEENCTLERFELLLDGLLGFIRSDVVLERQRALACFVMLLNKYAALKPADKIESDERDIKNLGKIIGILVPRLADSNIGIRKVALTGLHTILHLNNEYHSDADGYKKTRDLLERLTPFRPMLATQDSKELFAHTRQIANFLSIVVTIKDLSPLMDELLTNGLVDVIDDGANGACVVLNGLTHKLGNKIGGGDVHKYLHSMIDAMPKVASREQTLNGLLHCVKALTKHHPAEGFTALLDFDVPHGEFVIKSLQMIGTEPALFQALMQHIIDVMLKSQLFDEHSEENIKTKVTEEWQTMCKLPLSAATAIGELSEIVVTHATSPVGKSIRDTAVQFHTQVMCSMLLYICAAHEVTDKHLEADNPKDKKKDRKDKDKKGQDDDTRKGGTAGPQLPTTEYIRNSFKTYVERMYGVHCNVWIEQAGLWQKYTQKGEYIFGLCEMVKIMVTEAQIPEDERDVEKEDVKPLTAKPCNTNDCTQAIYKFMVPYIQKHTDCYRLSACAVVGQLLFHCKGDKDIIEGAMNCLLSRSASTEQERIKLLGIANLKNITVHPYNEISGYIAPVITTLVGGFQEDSDQVVLETMRTLDHLLTNVDAAAQFATVVTPVCIKLQPAFTHPTADIRANAYKLFGILVDLCTQGKLESTVIEQQMFLNLPSIVVHINDEHTFVRNTGKQCLHNIVAYLVKNAPGGKTSLKPLFQKAGYQVDKKIDYDEFSREFTAIWVREYNSHVNDTMLSVMNHFKSQWDIIRANAAIFVGSLLSHLDEEGLKKVNTDQAMNALMGLLKSQPEMVRLKAVKALGLFLTKKRD